MKIVQICPYPETAGVIQGVLALMEDGRLYISSIVFETNGDISMKWIQLPDPDMPEGRYLGARKSN